MSQQTTPDIRVRGGERDAMRLEGNGQTQELKGLAGGSDVRWGREMKADLLRSSPYV